MVLVPTFMMDFDRTFPNIQYANMSGMFDFHSAGIKVKVVEAIFRKKNVIASVPTFIIGFNIT